MKNYRKLQNGSDIRGVAISGVPGEEPDLTPEAASDIARGFTLWLCRRTGRKPADLRIAVGRDPRITGESLMKGLMNGFGPYGVKVYDCGLASTPAMYMATVFPETACDAGIMITASHLPYNRNGFKFFVPEGGLNKPDIRSILENAEDDAACEAELGGCVRGSGDFRMEDGDIMSLYCAHLRKIITDGAADGDRPLEGMRILVDAGNGSAGFYATRVLEPLGADISCSRYLEPDGMFRNHAPNPEDKAALDEISAGVVSEKADFGLIFDTDVDRSAAIDEKGRQIARNGIVAMASVLIAGDHPGSTVVTDSVTSRQLTEYLEKELGLKHLRFRRGYRNVINKAKELNEQGTDCQLAIETSGHAALKENYFLDDGAYLAAKIVIKAAELRKEGRKLGDILEALEEPADEREYRIPIRTGEFGAYGDRVLRELEEFVRESDGLSLEEPNYEGVRINFDDGWCLLRKSLHDPIMPMNMAADHENGCRAIADVMKGFLSSYSDLDLSVME